MAKLQAGTVSGLENDTLAGKMDAEFVSLWPSVHDTQLPTDARAVKERRLMFVAIARGLLIYLHEHRSDIGTTEEFAGDSGSDIGTTEDFAGDSGSEHSHQLEFDWD